MDLEQHFVADPQAFASFAQLNFTNRDIVEFGAGTGALTRALLDRGARSVEAWEIDPDLSKPFSDPRLSWKLGDILTARPSDVAGRCVASFPPYQTLPFLLDLCAGCKNLLLMVPGKYLEHCASLGLHQIDALPGSVFFPPSRGVHYLVARGFK